MMYFAVESAKSNGNLNIEFRVTFLVYVYMTHEIKLKRIFYIWIHLAGVRQVYVHVDRNNRPAQLLYQKMGFEVI